MQENYTTGTGALMIYPGLKNHSIKENFLTMIFNNHNHVVKLYKLPREKC